MKIRDIQVDGFGHFVDQSFGPLERPIIVFHGANEAGKTTLLEFVRRVLYGFPDGRSTANPYRPLAGGNHGGGLTIESADRLRYNVRRTYGTRGGIVTLTAATGEPLPDAELLRLLGGNPEYIFNRVFTFTLEELYASDLLSDENVNDYIYSEGMGVSALPDALRQIRRERENLFRKGGSTQQIYHVANRLRDVDGSLQEVANNAANFARLTDDLDNTNERLRVLAKRRDSLSVEQRHFQRLRSCWSDWIALDAAESRLGEIPAIEGFPSDGVSRLDRVEERIRSARRSLANEQEQVQHLAEQVEGLAPRTVVLEREDEIHAIARGSNSLEQSIKDLPEREAELRTRGKNFEETLRELGPAWDEGRLEQFDLSLEVRQQVAELGDRLRSADEEQQRCESDLAQLRIAMSEATEAEEEARKQLDAAAPPSLNDAQIRERRGLVRAARASLGTRDRSREQKEALDGQLATSPTSNDGGGGVWRLIAGICLAMGIALAALGPLIGGGAMAAMVTVGFLVAAAGLVLLLYLFRTGVSGGREPALLATIRQQQTTAAANVERCESELAQFGQSLGFEVTETSLSDAEEELEGEANRIQAHAQLAANVNREAGIKETRKKRLEDAERKLETASERQREASGAWQTWLRSRELSDRFTPDSVDLLAGQIARARDQLGTVRNWEQRVEAIRQDLTEHYQAVEPHASALGIRVEADDHRSVDAAADRLIDLLGEARDTERDRKSLEDRLREREGEAEAAQRELVQVEQELRCLLELGGATNAEDFRRRHSQAEERRSLESSRRDILQRLTEASGPGAALGSLLAALERTDSQSIDVEIEKLEEDLGDVQAKHERTATDRGSIDRQLQEIAGEEESSRLRMARGQLIEEMRAHAGEWAKLTLAEALIDQARSKFERERQPDVIREAEAFFRDTTGGRYDSVFSPIDERTIYVSDSRGGRKQPSELSRGTREQLFLSLRFGLIQQLGKDNETLPVIVDEVLVNFDPERALRAASAFVRLAQDNQMLIFTCHPNTVDLFKKAAAIAGAQEPQVINL